MIYFRSSEFKRYPLLIFCTSVLFSMSQYSGVQAELACKLARTAAIKLFVRFPLNVTVLSCSRVWCEGSVCCCIWTWFSNFGFICSKNRKGEQSFGCRMAPLTELIILCLHTVCDHPEPKLEPRPSSLHLEGKSLMQAGGVLFCIVCSETIF